MSNSTSMLLTVLALCVTLLLFSAIVASCTSFRSEIYSNNLIECLKITENPEKCKSDIIGVY